MVLGVFINGLERKVGRILKGRKELRTVEEVLRVLQDVGEGGEVKNIRKVDVEEGVSYSGSEKSYVTAVGSSSNIASWYRREK